MPFLPYKNRRALKHGGLSARGRACACCVRGKRCTVRACVTHVCCLCRLSVAATWPGLKAFAGREARLRELHVRNERLARSAVARIKQLRSTLLQQARLSTDSTRESALLAFRLRAARAAAARERGEEAEEGEGEGEGQGEDGGEGEGEEGEEGEEEGEGALSGQWGSALKGLEDAHAQELETFRAEVAELRQRLALGCAGCCRPPPLRLLAPA